MNINKIRRNIIKNAGITLIGLPTLGLIGCGGTGGSGSSNNSSKGSLNNETTTTISSNSWASGDTSLISSDFPDTSLFESSTQCNVEANSTTTEGPCYLGVSEKEDISEGKSGLPMMLCFQLTDINCNPLENYLIEVWHCDNEGIYSGDETQSDDSSSFAGSFCTNNDTEAENSVWFRGELTTDSEGRVNFKSCFPGWYSGRTIHIHYRIKNGSNELLVSQFCFTDDFCEEICTTHNYYSSRGIQDTTLSSGTDTVFPSSNYDEYLMNTQQNDDGSLLAYKRIAINI